MAQTIKAVVAEFLSAEIALSNPEDIKNTKVNILLSFQDVDEKIFNIALNNNNAKDLFKSLLNTYAEIGCPAAATIKQFLEEYTE